MARTEYPSPKKALQIDAQLDFCAILKNVQLKIFNKHIYVITYYIKDIKKDGI